jgi:hypothetical protein
LWGGHLRSLVSEAPNELTSGYASDFQTTTSFWQLLRRFQGPSCDFVKNLSKRS